LLTRTVAVGIAGAAATAASAQEKPAPKPAAGASPAAPNLNPPIITLKAGKLRGLREGKTLSFLGIKYADAERFGQPKPVQPWDGVKSAQVWGACCPSPIPDTVSFDELVFPHRYWTANENCQYLNVWTQNLTPATKKPVMVWMHGGGFTNGASMEGYAYDGRSLSEFGDVVVVSVNHRLNVIGTLDLSAYGAEYANSRNTGMGDLVASLQWVHDNIESFGGDPANVTIFGQSGGGGKVTRLMHMPSAKGLFHKVICESSSAVDYRNTDTAKTIQNQRAIAAETLKNLSLTSGDIAKLKTVPYRDLLAAATAASQTVARQSGIAAAGWDPVADDVNVLRDFCDWADSIPYMIGNVLSEFSSNLNGSQFDKNEWSAGEIDKRLTAAFGAKKDDIVAEYTKLYPRRKAQDVLYMDSRFRPWTKTMIGLKMEKAKAPVYSYMFTYEYQVNGGVTAFHCSEIAFAFHALSEPHIHLATGGVPSALALQDKVSQAWVNFARSGNPSQPGLAWKPWTAAGHETMVFDTVSEVRSLNDDKLLSLLPPPGPLGTTAPTPGRGRG
jgi:para-nitrobenzyl esterase